MEGDLSKEDEARLIEELDNARDEIKNIKMRQARKYCRSYPAPLAMPSSKPFASQAPAPTVVLSTW